MSINIKSVNKLEEQYRVIHPEHGELVAVMGSQQLKDLLILITKKEEQAFILRGVDIIRRYEGYVDTQVYLILEEHFDTINKLVNLEEFTDGYRMVSERTYNEYIKVSDLPQSRLCINGYSLYFNPRPEPFKWVKDRSPLDYGKDRVSPDDRVLVYNSEQVSRVHSMRANQVAHNCIPWADVKHKDRFTADDPAPSPYSQAT